jgi:catechol 2,3-dioxygenase-like lactoylglutathione lyase family enzyme
MEADVQLTYILAPVPDLAPALAFYRDTLGLDEAWREGAKTVAFWLPGRQVQVMVVVDGDPAGPMYRVGSVPAFLAEHPEVTVFMAARPIPGGSVAGYHDPAGNVSYVFDQVE